MPYRLSKCAGWYFWVYALVCLYKNTFRNKLFKLLFQTTGERYFWDVRVGQGGGGVNLVNFVGGLGDFLNSLS